MAHTSDAVGATLVVAPVLVRLIVCQCETRLNGRLGSTTELSQGDHKGRPYGN